MLVFVNYNFIRINSSDSIHYFKGIFLLFEFPFHIFEVSKIDEIYLYT